MNSFTPGIIIAALIIFLVGLLVGYSLVQKRFRQQAEALKVSQRRLTEVEQSHELRLREATDQLRHDYETQLAGTIEHYQDQLSQKTVEMEQTYETRFRVMQQGRTAVDQPTASNHRGVAVMPMPGGATDAMEGGSPAKATSQRELMHLKQQYETRLNEAAEKLQKSYEKQLAEHVNAARDEMQAEFDQNMAVRYQALEQEFASREAELEDQLAALRIEAETASSTLASEVTPPTPSEIMGTGDETTMALASPGSAAAEMSDLADMRYTQRELDQQVAAATQQAQADFDQRLAEELSAQQVQLDRRLEELEAEYAQRLSSLEQTAQSEAADPMDAFLSDDGYEDLVSDLDDEATSAVSSVEPPAPVTDDIATGGVTEDAAMDELFAADSTEEPSAGLDDALPTMTDEETILGEPDDLATIVDTATEATEVLSEAAPTDGDLFGDDDESLFSDDVETLDANPLESSELEAEPLSSLSTESSEADIFAIADDSTPDLETSIDIETESASSDLESDLFGEADDLTADLETVVANPEASSLESEEDLFGEADDLAADLEALSDEPSETSLPEPAGDDLFGEADDLVADLETATNETNNDEVESLGLEDALFGEADGLAADLEVSGDSSNDEGTSSSLEGDLFGEEDLFGDAPSTSEKSVEDVNALFGDEDFLAETSDKESGDDDDDDDFGPLDLSDISQLT